MSDRETDPERTFARGRKTTFLAAEAAIQACPLATARGFVIYRVEGGIWHEGRGCEMRYDAIWDGEWAPLAADALARNNEAAKTMIAEDNEGCDTFVLSLVPNGLRP